MKRTSVIAAAAAVLAANAFALLHAWQNRTGTLDTEITLTQRELPATLSSVEDDSSVSLFLQWRSSFGLGSDAEDEWLSEAKLRELGFDLSVPASDPHAVEFYQRQRRRRAFIAIEYEAPAWQRRMELLQKAMEAKPERANMPGSPERISHLTPTDAALDAVQLRARHPGSEHVIILPATIGIQADRFHYMDQKNQPKPRVSGYISDIPQTIHVPLPFSQEFRTRIRAAGPTPYRVRLRYGPFHEPWVVGVEFR